MRRRGRRGLDDADVARDEEDSSEELHRYAALRALDPLPGKAPCGLADRGPGASRCP